MTEILEGTENKKINISITILMKNGESLTRTTELENIKKGEFINQIIHKLTEEDKKWFYFIEKESPIKTTLIKLEEIAYVRIYEE